MATDLTPATSNEVQVGDPQWICLKGEHDGASFEVMTGGAIKIEVGGSVHVRTPREWHALAVGSVPLLPTAPSFSQWWDSCSDDFKAENREESLKMAWYSARAALTSARSAIESTPVDPESEAANPVWDLVIQTCAQAWPAGKLAWNNSPTELIVDIINERDQVLEALYEVVDAVASIDKPWDLQGHGIEAKRAEAICELAAKGKPNV